MQKNSDDYHSCQGQREGELPRGKVTEIQWLAVGSNFTAEGFGCQQWEVKGTGLD